MFYKKKDTKSEESKPHSDSFIKPTVQQKLKIGESNDKYEQEADRVADKVVNKSKGDTIQKKGGEEELQKKSIASEVTPLVQKKGSVEEEPVQKMQEDEPVQMKEEEEPIQKMEEDEPVQMKEEEEPIQKMEEEEPVQMKEEEEPIQKMEEDEPVQMKEEEEPIQKMEEEEPVQKKEEEEAVQTKKLKTNKAKKTNSIEHRLKQSKGKGSQMEGGIKHEMESGFGNDFSKVNIHTDSNAAQLSQDLGAQAFAHGNDVYFNKGKYDPSSLEGKGLLAHELTHTIQQEGATEKDTTKNSTNALEKDADRSTVGIMRRLLDGAKGLGQQVMPKLKSGLRVSRCQSDSPDKVKEKIKKLTPEQKMRLLMNKEVQKKMKENNVSFKEMDKKEGHNNKTFNSYHLMRIMNYRNSNWDKEFKADGKKNKYGYGKNDYHDCVTSFCHNFEALYNLKHKDINYATAEREKGKKKDGAFEGLTKRKYVSDTKDFFEYSKSGKKGTENNTNVTHFKESPSAWALKVSPETGVHVFGASLNEGFHAMTLIIDRRGGGKPDFYLQDQHRKTGALDRSSPLTAKEVDAYFIKFSQVNVSQKGYRKVKLFKMIRKN